MRSTFLLAFIVTVKSSLFAQKTPLDSSCFDAWPVIYQKQISNNGNYVNYIIENQPYGHKHLIVQNINTGWKKEYYDITQVEFTEDSKQLIFIKKDTLQILELDGNITYSKSSVSFFKQAQNYKSKWVAYKLLNTNDILEIYSLYDKRKKEVSNVISYEFNKHLNILLYKTRFVKDSLIISGLQILNWDQDRIDTIWKSSAPLSQNLTIGDYAIDLQNEKIAFKIIQSKKEKLECSIWCYSFSSKRISCLFAFDSTNAPTGYALSSTGEFTFNSSGNKLFLTLNAIQKPPFITNKGMAAVDIWNYKEEKLQSEQFGYMDKTKYLAVFNIQNNQLCKLETDADMIINYSIGREPKKGNFLLAMQQKYLGEYTWQKDFSQSLYLISSKDGSRKTVISGKHLLSNYCLSPNEEYIIWYNDDLKTYFSYDIEKALTKRISSQIPYPLYDNSKSSPREQRIFGIAGWLRNDSGVLIYDRFDLWQVDMAGKTQPKNITNGYGRKNGIVLGIANQEINGIYAGGEELLLGGFDRATKNNGFFKLRIGYPFISSNKVLQAYSYCIPRTVPYTVGREIISAGIPTKARDKEIYILTRMKASEAPNYYITTDFIQFKPLSDVHPEKGFNWLTTELYHWKMPNGKTSQGILYKPEDFNPNKRYPIIFYYYEEKSDELNTFIYPKLSNFAINIPYYVSNGYLVFVPDVYFEKGQTGQGAINSIVSAAHNFSSFPWIDSKHMGLMGQSFGGYETNYIVTHSNIFAAACEGSGVSDIISCYGQFSGRTCQGIGSSMQSYFERGQSYIGATPWERPDLYIKNSAIFTVHKVTTPLLIWHNKGDESVPFEQALEMFLNLRRAEKKVWMLQYDGDGHSTSGKNAVDLTIRMKQFFDHYLKDILPPKWMTEGIPAKYKMVYNGLELDSSGAKP